MKAIILALLATLVLASCATSQQAQTTFVQSCGAYNVAFNGAIQLRLAGKLSSAEIDEITLLDKTVTPLCTGTLPSDPSTLIPQVEAAITQITVGIINQHASTK